MHNTHVSTGGKGADINEHEQSSDKLFSVFAQRPGVLVAKCGDHGLQSAESAVQPWNYKQLSQMRFKINILFLPSVISMMKKIMDQNTEPDIVAIASG